MKCTSCGEAELVHDIRDIPYLYKGHQTMIKGIEADFCPNCGEFEMTREIGDKFSAAMLAFNKSVNSSNVDIEFIVRVREKLRLDKRRASEIFGGGVNAFSRYETGRATPPLSLMLLFKILDRDPTQMSVIIDEEISPPPLLQDNLIVAVEEAKTAYFRKISSDWVDNFKKLTMTIDTNIEQRKTITKSLRKQHQDVIVAYVGTPKKQRLIEEKSADSIGTIMSQDVYVQNVVYTVDSSHLEASLDQNMNLFSFDNFRVNKNVTARH